MSIKKAYNSWANIYDSNKNRTRDLDKIATQKVLGKYEFETVLEMGCGTGKNTGWLLNQANKVIGFDFSEGMLEQARLKIQSEKVEFRQVNLTEEWKIQNDFADLIMFNLVLEHISDLNFIFYQAHQKLKKGGKLFICELHPFKQYNGSKARYETENGTEILEVFTHHISEFVGEGLKNDFQLLELNEWFDDGNETEIPRLISFVFEK